MSQKLINSYTQFCDGNGNPLAGGSLVFSETGTDTPKTVYSAENQSGSLGSSVDLDSAGRPTSGGSAVEIYSAATGAYRVTVKDSSGTSIVVTENVSALTSFSSLTMTGQLLADDSTSTSAPPYSFDGDTDTGLIRPAANTVGLTTGGTEAARVQSDQTTWFKGDVGFNTGSPRVEAEVRGQLAVGDDLGSVGSGDVYIYRGGGTDPVLRMYDTTNDSFIQGGSDLRFGTFSSTGTTADVIIDQNGNVLIGGTASPASALKSLAIFNGTAPSGSVTDGVVLYAEDVSSSSELKVRDEAGNVTVLSPHNFSLIPEGPSEDMAWSYYSERDGKRINVDMLKAVRILERLSGETLVHESR